MTLKQFVLFIILATGIGWVGWIWTILAINPLETNLIGFIIFYATLLLSLCGTFTLLTLWYRFKKNKEEAAFYLVNQSFRQGVLLSWLAVGLLMFQAKKALSLTSVLILLTIFVAIEVVFLARDSHRKRKIRPSAASNDIGMNPTFQRKAIQPIQEDFSDQETKQVLV